MHQSLHCTHVEKTETNLRLALLDTSAWALFLIWGVWCTWLSGRVLVWRSKGWVWVSPIALCCVLQQDIFYVPTTQKRGDIPHNPREWDILFLVCILLALGSPLLIFMPPKELWEAYSNRTVRPSVCPSVCPSRFRVRSISPIFFEVGISN